MQLQGDQEIQLNKFPLFKTDTNHDNLLIHMMMTFDRMRLMLHLLQGRVKRL